MILTMEHKTPLDERELKSAIMDQLEEEVDKYFVSFKTKSNNKNHLPTIDEIEDMLTDLRSKTRDIYLSMVSSSLDGFDESELISSKKENSKRKE